MFGRFVRGHDGRTSIQRCHTGERVPSLRDATRRFGTPDTMLSGNGSCLVGRGVKGRQKSQRPLPEYLIDRGRTDKLQAMAFPVQRQAGTLPQGIEDQAWHRESLSKYVRYYNGKRLHVPLGMDECGTPLLAFGLEKAADAIRKTGPNRMKEDSQAIRNNFHTRHGTARPFHGGIWPGMAGIGSSMVRTFAGMVLSWCQGTVPWQTAGRAWGHATSGGTATSHSIVWPGRMAAGRSRDCACNAKRHAGMKCIRDAELAGSGAVMPVR